MCGLGGIHRRNDKPIQNLGAIIDGILKGIERRGTDATGLLALKDSGEVHVEKRCVAATQFIRERKTIGKQARTVLLHTRFATVGDADDPRNAHPVGAGTIAAVHNGTISNASELFQKNGLERLARVDSEIIPAMVNATGWDKIEDVFSQFSGGAAVALVNAEKPRELIFARTRSYPLVYLMRQDYIVWASTLEVLKNALFNAGSPIRKNETIVHLPEGAVHRINGKVTTSRFNIVPVVTRSAPNTTPVPSTSTTPTAAKKPVTKKEKKAARKAARKTAEQAQLTPQGQKNLSTVAEYLASEGLSGTALADAMNEEIESSGVAENGFVNFPVDTDEHDGTEWAEDMLIDKSKVVVPWMND